MSVPMSRSNTWTAAIASGTPKTSAKAGATCGTLEHKVYMMDFCKFSLATLPCSIPTTADLKLSSSRMMSAASFATSVPRMPMTMPTSACFNAGASLTPSPVIATMSPTPCLPKCWNACTITCLCMGDTRAKTLVVTTTFSQKARTSSRSLRENLSSAGNIPSNCEPMTTSKSCASMSLSSEKRVPSRIPTRAAMARAVAGWSPVIITTAMPASWAARTASATPSLGGSSIPKKPKSSKP
mmetsp:Transcript_98690/g.276376  ORF Transcript_98690/g.276376 Transcript_98690/m.276376 type:complete len:240 (-) Transcript_98690:83-802(-)